MLLAQNAVTLAAAGLVVRFRPTSPACFGTGSGRFQENGHDHHGPAKLPPMSALEFAIEKTFRHFFFGVKLAVMWAILIVPLLVAAYFVAFRAGMPTLETLTPAAKAVLGLLAFVVLIATFSAAVNWHRRILLDDTARRFGWVRLDSVVWKYLLGFVLVAAAVAILAFAAAASIQLISRETDAAVDEFRPLASRFRDRRS